jgi:hypothetical protein
MIFRRFTLVSLVDPPLTCILTRLNHITSTEQPILSCRTQPVLSSLESSLSLEREMCPAQNHSITWSLRRNTKEIGTRCVIIPSHPLSSLRLLQRDNATMLRFERIHYSTGPIHMEDRLEIL